MVTGLLRILALCFSHLLLYALLYTNQFLAALFFGLKKKIHDEPVWLQFLKFFFVLKNIDNTFGSHFFLLEVVMNCATIVIRIEQEKTRRIHRFLRG